MPEGKVGDKGWVPRSLALREPGATRGLRAATPGAGHRSGREVLGPNLVRQLADEATRLLQMLEQRVIDMRGHVQEAHVPAVNGNRPITSGGSLPTDNISFDPPSL